jgi:uncharacterized cupin superfamily protein
MTRRLLLADANTAELPDQLAPGTEIVAGQPTANSLAVDTGGIADIGLWSMTEGHVRDIEADEVFLVLAGRATVTIAGGATEGDEVLHLQPGALVRLYAGDHTEWLVTEAVRKLYISPEIGSADA